MVDNLRPLFAGEVPVFAADTPEVCELLARRGLRVVTLDALLDDPAENVVLVVQLIGTARAQSEPYRASLRQSRVLLLPVCSFNPALRAVEHTVDILLASDFELARARSRRWSEMLRQRPSPLLFRKPELPETTLEVHLLGDLRVTGPPEGPIEPGVQESVIRYFELEMEVFDESARYFRLEGQLAVDGVLTAMNRSMAAELEPLHTEMNGIIEKFGGRPGLLTVADNRLASFVVDGTDLTEDVARLSGEAYDRNFVEFSIGLNSPPVEPDWSLNCLLTEGSAGVHVAVGDGVVGAHVDFVSAGARLVV